MSTPAAPTSEPPSAPLNNRWPGQVKFILGNEAAERFSYYGMKAILAIYITNNPSPDPRLRHERDPPLRVRELLYAHDWRMGFRPAVGPLSYDSLDLAFLLRRPRRDGLEVTPCRPSMASCCACGLGLG